MSEYQYYEFVALTKRFADSRKRHTRRRRFVDRCKRVGESAR